MQVFYLIMEDNYTHVDDGLIYVLENIPGSIGQSVDYNKIHDEFNSQLTAKCYCKQVCLPHSCLCLKKGVNYLVNSANTGLQLNRPDLSENSLHHIFECNDLCSCSANCGNRLVQRGPLKTLYISNGSNSCKGFGLFSTHSIPKHTFVCEYAGEVITKAEAVLRHQANVSNGKMNYIFCLNEHSNGTTLQTFVDPSVFGNIGRYANHSCDPNCIIVPVRVNTPIPKLAIFSCADILPHTEITFQYGSSNSFDLVTTEIVRKECLCGTLKCTGFMPYQSY